MTALGDIADLHRPTETTVDSVMGQDGDWKKVDQHGGVVCMTCQGYPPAPCATYLLATGDAEEGLEVARVTITRRMTPDDLLDFVAAEDGEGNDLPLTEALGMMRLAEDTIIRERTDEDGVL